MAGLDHFDLLSSYYERVIPLRNLEEIVHFSDLPINGALLDAGGGTGRVSKALRDLASNIVLLDLSIPMLMQASDHDYINKVNAHTEAFPFPDEYFERIIMIDAMHHVCSQLKTVGELWRILKPGGKIIIEEPDFNRFLVKMLALAEKVALMRSHFLTPERISSMFLGYANSEIRVVKKEFNAWIVVEKKFS